MMEAVPHQGCALYTVFFKIVQALSALAFFFPYRLCTYCFNQTSISMVLSSHIFSIIRAYTAGFWSMPSMVNPIPAMFPDFGLPFACAGQLAMRSISPYKLLVPPKLCSMHHIQGFP